MQSQLCSNMTDQDSFSDSISWELSEVDACKGLVNYPKAKTKITKLTRPRLGCSSSPPRRKSELSGITSTIASNEKPLPCPVEMGFLHAEKIPPPAVFDGWGTSFQETPPVSNRTVFAVDSSIFTSAPSAVEEEYSDGWGTSSNDSPPAGSRSADSSICTNYSSVYKSNTSIYTTNTKSTKPRPCSMRSGGETHFFACIRLKYSHALPNFKDIPRPTREKVPDHTCIGYGVLSQLASKVEDCQSFSSSTKSPLTPPSPSKLQQTEVDPLSGSRSKLSPPSTTSVSQLRSVHRPEPPQDPGADPPAKKDLASTWKDSPSVPVSLVSSDGASYVHKSSSPSTASGLDSNLSRNEPRRNSTIRESSNDNEEDESESDDKESSEQDNHKSARIVRQRTAGPNYLVQELSSSSVLCKPSSKPSVTTVFRACFQKKDKQKNVDTSTSMNVWMKRGTKKKQLKSKNSGRKKTHPLVAWRRPAPTADYEAAILAALDGRKPAPTVYVPHSSHWRGTAYQMQ